METYKENINKYVKKIQEAKFSLMRTHPFYAVLLMHINFGLDNYAETAYTNGKLIAFAPDFLDKLSSNELQFVLMHEVMHIVLNHCNRLIDGMDLETFNIACDIVVNSNILYSLDNDASKITVKEFGESIHLAPDGKEGYEYTIEEVYQMLLKKELNEKSKIGNKDKNKDKSESDSSNKDSSSKKDNPSNEDRSSEKENSLGNGGSSGKNNFLGESNSSEKDKSSDKDSPSEKDNSSDKDSPSKKDDSSKKDNSSEIGNSSKKDKPSDKNGSSDRGGSFDKDSLSDKDNSSEKGQLSFDDHSYWGNSNDSDAKEEWKQIAIEAKKIQDEFDKKTNKPGSLPMLLERQIDEYIHPQTNWREILQDFIQIDIIDYSFNPPDRRMQDNSLILPDFNEKEEVVKNIWFIVDTSGSVGKKELTIALSEIKGALDQFNNHLEAQISFFDANITKPKKFYSIKEFQEIKAVGGGGTSFEIIFNKIDEYFQDEKPSYIIILTDGYANFPQEEVRQEIPVLWLINNDYITPPWGKVGRIKLND